jgi:hypothetical protein
MRKPQQILEDCRDIMPFDLKECFDPYMIECMEIYAKEYHKSKVESGLLHSVSERNIAIGDYVWYNERIHKVTKIRFDDEFWKGKEIAIIDIQAKDTKDVPTRVLRYVR